MKFQNHLLINALGVYKYFQLEVKYSQILTKYHNYYITFRGL